MRNLFTVVVVGIAGSGIAAGPATAQIPRRALGLNPRDGRSLERLRALTGG